MKKLFVSSPKKLGHVDLALKVLSAQVTTTMTTTTQMGGHLVVR